MAMAGPLDSVLGDCCLSVCVEGSPLCARVTGHVRPLSGPCDVKWASALFLFDLRTNRACTGLRDSALCSGGSDDHCQLIAMGLWPICHAVSETAAQNG